MHNHSELELPCTRADQMWTNNYVHNALSTQTTLTGTCQTNEIWKSPQRHFARRAYFWKTQSWESPVTLPRCVQTNNEGIDKNKWEELTANEIRKIPQTIFCMENSLLNYAIKISASRA